MRTIHLSRSERAAYGADRLRDDSGREVTPDYIQPAIGGVPVGRPLRVRKGSTDVTPNSIDLGPLEAERVATWDRVLP